MEMKSQSQQLIEKLKENKEFAAIAAVSLLASLYFSNGGSINGATSYVKHPFDSAARQVYNVMGYSNPALVKQLEEGRKTLEAGLTTPTYFNVYQWGPKDGEKDEYELKQTIADSEFDVVGRGVSVEATSLKLTATLVGRDGCADFQIEHLIEGQNHLSKICLSQGESIVVPLKKSKYQLERESARKSQEEKLRQLFAPSKRRY